MVLHRNGGLDAQKYHTDWPAPALRPGTVLIRVYACGLNSADVNVRTAWYPPDDREVKTDEATSAGYNTDDTGKTRNPDDPSGPFPLIQGSDPAGMIIAVGDGVSRDRIGDRVIVDGWIRDPDQPSAESQAYLGMQRDGGFAEYLVVPELNALTVSALLSFAEMATLQVTSTTAENMLSRAGLSAGECIVVTGASGRVGSALVQHARARSAHVIAVTSASRRERVRSLGADAVIERGSPTLSDDILAANGGNRIDVLTDLVGGPTFAACFETVAPKGRVVVSGAVAGPIVEIDLRTFFLREVVVTGATTFGPNIPRRCIELVKAGAVRPQLHKIFPLSQFIAAQSEFMAKAHSGAIVVCPDAVMDAATQRPPASDG